jgi:hypothetical protein
MCGAALLLEVLLWNGKLGGEGGGRGKEQGGATKDNSRERKEKQLANGMA